MLTIISIFLCAAIVMALAYIATKHATQEAAADTRDIQDGIPIDHAEELRNRVIVMGVFYVIALIVMAAVDFFLPVGIRMWMLGAAMATWGTWTVVFRTSLNRLRQLPWYYMDDMDEGGNNYDEFWWMVRLFFYNGRFRRLTEQEWDDMVKLGINTRFEKQVAIMAMATELSAMAIGIFLCNWSATMP